MAMFLALSAIQTFAQNQETKEMTEQDELRFYFDRVVKTARPDQMGLVCKLPASNRQPGLRSDCGLLCCRVSNTSAVISDNQP